jgi:YbbR domain-containing protein
VKVPITGPSKTVPIQIKREGELPKDLSIQSIDLEPHGVTLFGSQKVLDSLDFVNVTLDLSDITKDTTVELDVSTPDGVNKVAPDKVKAIIDVAKQSTKTLKDIPIKVIGQSDGLSVSFIDPSDQQVDVKLKGTKEALKDIQPSDIEANIDVTGLSTGEQFPDIEISGLPDNVKAEPESKKAKVRITEGT